MGKVRCSLKCDESWVLKPSAALHKKIYEVRRGIVSVNRPFSFCQRHGRHARVAVKPLLMDGLLPSMIGCMETRKVGTVNVNAHEDCDAVQVLDS